MRIFGWSADETGCGYYRMHLPLKELARHGHQTLVSTKMPEDWFGESDVIIGQRVCLDGPTGRWQHLATAGRFLVLELDDDLFQTDRRSPAAHQLYSRPQIRDNLRRNIQVASRVTVTTERLADRLSSLNPEIRVVPNLIPEWLFDCGPALGLLTPGGGSQTVPVATRGQDGTSGCTVGWAGTATHEMDWAELNGPLARLMGRDVRIGLHLMGWLPPIATRLDPERYRFTPWIGSVPEYLQALDFDLGLIPLAPHVFNAAKSDLKFLELAALGIPAVVSDYGPYADSVQHGITGLLFKLPHQAIGQLRELINDPGRRQEIGQAARNWATHRTIEGNWRLWEQALIP